jgi:hypothetical protein
MSIDSVPAVQSIIEQTGLLERAFHGPLMAKLAYSRLAEEEMFPNGIGETLTKSKPALFPLASALTPMNPANNTGLDNGLSDVYFPFEQYQLGISEYALSTTVNIMQDATLIQKIFLQNYVQLGEHAGRTIDGLCSQAVHSAYDAGNTFATVAASSGTTITVDNINGFDTAYSSTNSPGLPVTTSGSIPQTVSVINGTTGAVKGTFTVTGATAANPNTSTAFIGSGATGVVYGRSGTLTTSATIGISIAVGDQIVANDGAYVQRPNGKTSRFQLAATDTLTLAQIAGAVAKLRARNVPTLPGTDNYLCIIDPTIWPQLLSDNAFNYATMGQMGEGYFKTSIVNRTLGVEFINSNLVPRYFTLNGGATPANNTTGVYARHAVIGGMGLLVKGTFQGSLDAARQANTMQNGDVKLIHDAKISLITRGPVDRLQEFVTQTWRWVGGFVVPTDVTSTPLVIPTTDYARSKRAVVIEVASAS